MCHCECVLGCVLLLMLLLLLKIEVVCGGLKQNTSVLSVHVLYMCQWGNIFWSTNYTVSF